VAALLLGLAMSFGTGTAQARDNHALLVGVNVYENFPEKDWLNGPGNDVSLVAAYLTAAAPVPFAPGNVTVLADAVPGAGRPTLAAIRGAFADLTARVQPGDFVYLHFSGHGSQVPALDPDSELDGLDEVFLPVDSGPLTDPSGEIETVLRDDEIGQFMDALAARGAQVWVVFDACHSGTATRAAGTDDEVRTRHIAPEALGFAPDRLAPPATRGAADDPHDRPEAPLAATGSVVAFFAAQTTELTPEKNLPKNDPGRVTRGVFTFTLFEALAEYPGATYAQIGQEVLRKYAVTNRARTTPMFEGDLDRVVFGGAPQARVAQWPATVDGDGFTLPAGTLHGLAEGARLAVLPSPAAGPEEVLGEVVLTSVDTFTATAAAAAPLAGELPKIPILRQTTPDIDFALTVALPAQGSAPALALQAAMSGLAEVVGPRVRLVAEGQEADLRLAVIPDSPRPDAIWVLPATGLAEDLSRTPSVSTADKTPEELAEVLGDTLARMAKAINLLKLGDAVGLGTPGVVASLMTRSPDAPTLRPLDALAVPRLVPGDEVHLVAENTTDAPVDLNVLYIGSDWSISHMWKGRMQPGDRLTQGLVRINDKAYGRDRLVLVVSPAKPRTAVEDLSFLAQDAVEVTRGGSALASALREAGFGEATRTGVSLASDASGPTPSILQFDIDTVPSETGED
jgi:hypothetical protein